MEKRQGNIIIHASGGTAAKGASTYKLTLPSAWMKEMGITDEARQVELSFDGNAITITKRRSVEVFIAERQALGHRLKKISYYDGDILCSTIAVDDTAQEICVENHLSNVIKTAFGNNYVPTWKDYERFLEDRCIPRARAGLREYLETIGVEGYDPMEIIQKTQGRMAEDHQWMELEVLA